MVALFVVLTFLLFLAIDWFVLRAEGKSHPAFQDYAVFDKSSLFFPKGLLLSPGHIWLKKMKDGFVKLGIDEFILKALGKVSLVNLKSEGDIVKKGDIIMMGKFGKNAVALRSPVNGIVKQLNHNIDGKAITNPYDNDWGMVVIPENFHEEKSFFKESTTAKTWLADEFRKFKDFLAVQSHQPQLAGITLQDGGNIVEGVLSSMDEESINKFEKEFLS